MRKDKSIKYYKLSEYLANLMSKDPNTKVGTLIIDKESYHILSEGYNGFPRGINEKDQKRWERPTKYKYVSHSEANAICNAARHGISLKNSIAVITMFPCSTCTKLLIQSGITEIVTQKPDFNHHRWGEEFKVSNEMLVEAGIILTYI
jgi:dCMP deaminase